jgi:hypothetical protein
MARLSGSAFCRSYTKVQKTPAPPLVSPVAGTCPDLSRPPHVFEHGSIGGREGVDVPRPSGLAITVVKRRISSRKGGGDQRITPAAGGGVNRTSMGQARPRGSQVVSRTRGLKVEHPRQIAGLMHETENYRRLRLGVVNEEIRKAAQGPKPVSPRRQLQPNPNFDHFLSQAAGRTRYLLEEQSCNKVDCH